MNRRRFLTGIAGILAAGVAPAVIPSGVLMPVRTLWTPSRELFTGGHGVYNGVTLTMRASADGVNWFPIEDTPVSKMAEQAYLKEFGTDLR